MHVLVGQLDLSDRRVFVAGATGLAGSAAVAAVLRAHPRAKIVAGHRAAGGAFIDDERITYVTGDFCQPADCRRMSEGCDFAVMAAAITGGAAASASSPAAQVTENVVMDARLFEAFHANRIRRVVYVSTASVYQPLAGHIREADLDWNLDPAPVHLGVGWAKRYGEKAAAFWNSKTGMQVIILRLANIFGPFAKFDPATSNVVPAIIRKAADRMDPFEVWSDADVTRDVIYADDFGDAVSAALCAGEVEFDVFNVGSGVPTTVGDIVQWTLEAAQHAPSLVQFAKNQPESLAFRVLDVSKANEILGWKPQVGIRDGICRTVDWWERNRGSWRR